MSTENQTQQPEQQEEPVELQFLGNLEIMQLVKNAQSQNGLKHGDFFRYRKYCAKKIKKFRATLKFSYGKGKKFQFKDITETHPNDAKILHVLLFEIEYYWAYAMDLRQQMAAEGDQGNRIKFHVAKKSLKAYTLAKKLLEICQQRTSESTAQECQAYTSFLGGFYNHEKERWNEALQNYIQSRKIYSELVKVSDSLLNAVFKEKIEQLDQSIRFVYYQTGGSMLDSLDTILGKSSDSSSSSQQQQQQSEKTKEQGLVEIRFQGEIYPIKNKKAMTIYQQTVLQAQKIQQLLDQSTLDLEQIQTEYIQLFQNYDDIIHFINIDKEDQKNTDAERKIYSNISSYFQGQKSEHLLQRNSLLIWQSVTKFDTEKGIENLKELLSKKALKSKLTRPAEIVKLCDNYLQIMKQLLEIERHNPNLDRFRELDGKEIFYKGLRCFFVALMYYSNDKITETLNLLNQVDSYFEYAENKFENNQKYADRLAQFQSKLDAFKIRVKVSYLESKHCGEKEAPLVQKKSEQITSGSIEELISENNLSGYKPSIDLEKMGQTPIMNILPKPQTSSCKAIFFDMAHSNLEYPEVQGEEQGQKKWGFLKKFGLFK